MAVYTDVADGPDPLPTALASDLIALELGQFSLLITARRIFIGASQRFVESRESRERHYGRVRHPRGSAGRYRSL